MIASRKAEPGVSPRTRGAMRQRTVVSAVDDVLESRHWTGILWWFTRLTRHARRSAIRRRADIISSRTGQDSNYQIRLPLQPATRLSAKPLNYTIGQNRLTRSGS